MREIKFRGLNKKSDWVCGSLINNCDGIPHMPKQNTKTWIVTSAFGNGGWFNIRGRHYVLPESVGQSTGLLDKNGIEIYEGDIVIVTKVEECGTDAEKEIVVVGNPEYLELSDAYSGGPENVWVVTEKEVIGNIHQNPELMEK